MKQIYSIERSKSKLVGMGSDMVPIKSKKSKKKKKRKKLGILILHDTQGGRFDCKVEPELKSGPSPWFCLGLR